MWGAKLCLLLLLGTPSLAQQDVGGVEEQSTVCSLAKRYKNFRRFVYDYEAETFNGVNGATDNKSGPKVSCTVEIDVPQTCSFIIRTTECSLSEIFDVDAEGNAVYRPAAGAQAFKSAMEKNSLKVTVEGQTDVKLFPEDDEPVNILNVKRGIVSALIVPALEEEKNTEMATVQGVCPTDLAVNAREDIATDVTVNVDLSRCDSFIARRQDVSPLALITGMNLPLSKMISSTQTCNYQFDNQKKHMTATTCTETHLLLPFSHKNEYGVTSVVKQTLSLRETAKINDRIFDSNEANLKMLPMDVTDEKSPVQTKDAALSALQTLSSLSQGEERAALFQGLVSELRVLDVEVLGAAADEMMDVSTPLTFQAVAQCGTPACTSAMLKMLRSLDSAALEVDAVVYAMGLLPNPSRLMVKDLLDMAQYKQSKPIMYALSNAVRRLYEAEGVTPEITAVYEFMASLVGADCAGEKELTFLTLRVIGNMGAAMEAADPTIKTTLLKCMRQPATTLSVQLAAIQAFRRMSVTDEVRANLQRVSQYPKGAVQKRLAAYLMLMRSPVDSDIEMVKKILTQEQNEQIKSFVTSHVYNIISSKAPETRMLGERILAALEDADIVSHDEYTTLSGNYKMGVARENMEANVQGNLIFDPSSQLPREVLLESTLKAFGFSMDIWEFGMEGKGFEPTIEALFGQNGFFPDTILETLYWADDKMPTNVKEVLEKYIPLRKSEERKAPENLMREIGRNLNKLVKDLQSQDSLEAMAYLKLMGVELGYVKSSELKAMADNAVMYGDMLMKILPTKMLTNLVSKTDNELFAHYIFMDNKFVLPTASGMPLMFALSGTFAPGAKGGLRLSKNMNELVFMPSVGVEFRTQMGIHMPEFVSAGVDMHTNLYHESALKAKISLEADQVKLSIPAPQGTTKLLRISNKVVIVGTGLAAVIPHTEGQSSCGSLFSGFRYCTKTLRAETGEMTPYFPLSGETSYAFDLKPSSEVSEFTAAIAYKLLNEGEDGLHKVDSLQMILRAEGAEPTEATATMKYNRNMNVFTTQVEIPDFDMEAGIKVGISDSSARGKAITFELLNKNVPQLSLIGRAKLQAMTEGMLQVQMLVPSLKTDATLTATMNNADGLTMEIKSDVKLPETSSIQAVVFKYGEEQVEVQLISNMNADTRVPLEYAGTLQAFLGQFAEDVMDQQVPNTDMKLRHIVTKGVEANRNWMERFSNEFPYAQHFWTTVTEAISMTELPAVPENVFMNLDSTFRYKFNQDRFTITVPLPLGGKSSEELSVPAVVSSPHISVPQLDFEFAPREIQIPTFTVPSEYDLTLPLMGMMEMSTKVNSNFYNWEATMSAGNKTEDSPSYLAKITMMADSPLKLLSFTAEGSTTIIDTAEKTMEVTLNGALEHSLLKTGVSVLETIAVTDNVLFTGRYSVNAASPVGLDTLLTITTQFTLDSNMLFGDLNTDGKVTVGPMTASTTYLHTFSFEPAKKEAKMESSLRMNSEILKVANKMKASYANEELQLESNFNVNSDFIKHTTKMNLNYKDVKLTIQCDAVTKAEERMLRNQLEFSTSEGQVTLRIENQADDAENRAYSLLTGAINPSGLEINADASINIFSSLASHKATLTLNSDGLTTSCTTTAQRSPLTFENVFQGGVDASGATMSLSTKGAIKENKAELSLEGKIASTDIYLNSIFKGNLFDINGRNRANLKLNEDGLIISNNMVGSFNEMRTENTHSLSLTMRSFSLHSKTDNVLNSRNSYMHDIKIDMLATPASASVLVKNDLKVMEVNFVNDAEFKAQPYNMELTGTLMGVFSEEELKHTYEIKFVDMILSAKCNTNGKLLGSHMTHTTDLELAGLTMKFNNLANLNSPYLRLDSNVKTVAEPFTLTVDAIFNSDGEAHLYGQQSGELYGKFLMKAEPTLFTHSFEYRASSTHELEDRPVIKTIMDGKINSMLSFPEQTVTMKMTSKINEHAFDQEMSAYNNGDKMGVEVTGAVATSLFSENSEDYSIAGFVKYDKNSESHFIQIPFIDLLPEAIEGMKTAVMGLMDQGIEMLRDVNSRYAISDKFQAKVAELKEVIDNFDFNLFAEDVKKFLKSIENFITNMLVKIQPEKVLALLESVKEDFMAWINKYDIANKFNALYTKVEEILSSYEIEKIISAIMDEIVKVMKQYEVREKIQHVFSILGSIDIQPLLQKVMVPAQELVNELYSFDFKQLIDDMSDYFMRMIQKVRSFDYDTFTVELKEKVADMSKIPCFGKLSGEFRVTSPLYKLRTTADLENTTTTSLTPEFKMNLNSQASSALKMLDFTLDASALVAAPERTQLTLAENIKVDQSCFTLDHKAEIIIYGLTTAEASSETTAKAATEMYVAELFNKLALQIENRISATVETNYKHDINMPLFSIFSDANVNQKTNLLLEDWTLQLTFNNVANQKLAIRDFSDEATHKSDMEVVMGTHTAKVTFAGETGCSLLKTIQNVEADICIFRHVKFDAKVETETPFMKGSIAEVKFQAKTEDLKIDFTASHNAELTGQVEGTLSSSAIALISPQEIVFDTKNKGNAKVALPFSLSGKMDIQNDMAFTLNSEVQKAGWTGLARFNQYKYAHFFTVDNTESEINVASQINGEANLDMLTERFTLPEMTIPFVGRKTPKVEDFSLWEDTPLGVVLTTTQQTLDMNMNLKYAKNPEMISFDINVEPLINAIDSNIKTLRKTMLTGKDRAAAILAKSYDSYSVELPETITIPAYRVPVMNLEMSAFTIPLPDRTLLSMPSQHISSALDKLTFPRITLPKIQNIQIPKMGDTTYEFSMKTAVITLKTDASILNQDGINMKLDASSSSEFGLLTGKIVGSSIVNTEEGLKIISALTLNHLLLEGTHEGTIILSPETAKTSITNSLSCEFLFGPSEKVHQEITGNSQEGLVVSMSAPNFGHLALQMQAKHPAQVKARLYGRYPSEPTTDIEIVGVKMSVVDSEKLSIQTSWNTEIPYEMVPYVKENVNGVLNLASDITGAAISVVNRRARFVTRKSQALFKRAVESLAEVDPSNVMTAVADNAISMLKAYQKKVEIVFNAVVQFLRETKFQIPGYEERLSGLEVYQKLSAFVADVSEEAIQKIPEYLSSMFGVIVEMFQNIKVTLPGSSYTVSGSEILDDLEVAFRKIQEQVLTTVRNLGQVQLEDIFNKISAFMQFIIEQSEKLLQTVRSQNVDQLSTFVSSVHDDAVNSEVLGGIVQQIEEAHRIVILYLDAVKDKIQTMLASVSKKQLSDDIQSWLDALLKGFNTFHNNAIRTLQEKSQTMENVRVSDREIEVDIPLPAIARFF